MPNPMRIRAVTRSDIPSIKPIVAATLFPAELLDDMIAPYFDDPQCADIWLISEIDGVVTSVLYCVPEKLTEGTWNLLAIAVKPEAQSTGIGQRLMQEIEEILTKRSERILIVETSGLPEFERTRNFYRRLGYIEEARIRNFYDAGDDKIIFWKSL